MIKVSFLFSAAVLLLGFPGHISGQYRSEAPILLIDEDFTDGAFDDLGSGVNHDSWQISGTGKILFAPPNDRDFPQALVRLPDFEGSAWSGAQWRRHRDLPWEHELNQVCFDKQNDIPVLRFRAFSDFSHSKHFAGVEVAMLEQRAVLDPPPHMGHDLSFEAEQTFWSVTGVVQLDANVENTGNWNVEGLRYAHFEGENAMPRKEDLDLEYDNEIIWRNEPGTGTTNIETWATLNNADFYVPKEMNAELDPDNPLGMFSLVQITLFRDNVSDAVVKRPGIPDKDLQIGIQNLQVGITKRSDFNLDFRIDEADLDILNSNWQTEARATIKQGDANNDTRVDFSDVPALLAYWSKGTVKDARATASYEPSTGALALQLKNISYVEISGVSDLTSGNLPDWSGLNPQQTLLSESALGAFSVSPLEDTVLELGPVLKPGIDQSELIWIVNFPGSGMPEGYPLLMSESLILKKQQVCAGKKESLYAEAIDDIVYTWEPASGMLLRDKQGWAETTLSDDFTEGVVIARGTDPEGNPRIKQYFHLSREKVPDIAGNINGPGSFRVHQDTVEFTIESDTSAVLYQWELPDAFRVISGEGSSRVIVVSDEAVSEGTIRVKVANRCGEGTWSEPFDIQVKSAVSVNERKFEKFSAYPNPAGDQLFLRHPYQYSGQIRYRVFNLHGMYIFEGSWETGTTGEEQVVPISNLSSGTYFIEILADGQRQIIPFHKIK